VRALTQHSSRRIYLAQMNPPFIIYSLYSSDQARTRMKQCNAAAKVNQNWKLFCSISDPVLYQNWISNCQMSIETIKQGSGQQAAVQCPGRGTAEEGDYWEICPSGLLAGAVLLLLVVCTYPVTHPEPGPAYVTLPPAPPPPRAQSSYSHVQCCRYKY